MTPIEPQEYRILDEIDDGILVVNEDCTVVWANPAFHRMFGGVDGRPGGIPNAISNLAARLAAATHDKIADFECRLRAPDGSERRYFCSGWRTSSEKGWLLRFREEPDHKRDYEAIVEYTGTATILIEEDGTISVANTEFERLSGYSRQEIIGEKRLFDFIALDCEKERILGYHSLRRREPGAAPKNYSFTFVDRSGNFHVVEATIGLIPGTARSVMSLLDVTERRRAEQALRESEERLSLALSAAEDGLIDWDVSSGAIYYSSRNFTMLGYSPDAFVPTIPTILALVHPKDRARVEMVFTALATGERDHAEIEFRMRSASGKWVYVLGRLRVVRRDAGGRPIRIAGTYSDITKRKEAERELQIGKVSLESSLAAIAIADLDGNITHVNRALLEMNGLTDPEEVLGRHIAEFWVEPTQVERILATLAEGGKYTGKLVCRKTNGTEFIAHVTVVLLKGDSEDPICIMVTTVDISEEMRMAQALRESRERYRALTELSPDVIFLIDTRGDVLYVNSAGGRLVGTDPEGLRGKNIQELFLPGLGEWWRTTIPIAIASPGEILTEEALVHGAGGDVWLEVRLIPMAGPDGTVRNLLGICRDITDQKRAEEQLRFQAQVLSQVEDAVIAVDTDERITYMNRAAERLFGVPSDEALGRPIPELFGIEWLHTGEGEMAKNALLSSGTWRGVAGHQKRDGETISIDVTLSTLTDDSGRVTGTLYSLRDVTRQQQAELDLRIRDMAIASSPSAFAIADLRGRLTYVNQAFLSLWGYASASEVLGRSVTEFWHDEAEAADALQRLLKTGRYTGERVGRRRDGTTFHIMFSGSCVTDNDGNPICLAETLTDITDLKEAEAEIQAHNRALSILNQIIGASASATDSNEVVERVLTVTLALLDLAGGSIYLKEQGGKRARLVYSKGLPEGFTPQPCIRDINAPPYREVLVEGRTVFRDDLPEEGESTPLRYASVPIVAHGRVIGALNVIPQGNNRFTETDRSLLAAVGREVGASIERALLIRQLEMAKEEANLYLDILSHDIRNAENISGLYTNLLADMLDGEEKIYAEKLRASIRKSVEILRNVSTIRRIHRESVKLVPIDLDRVIRDEIAIFPEIQFHYGGTSLSVMADRLLPEVFTNLIGNAIKFGGPKVEVAIRVEDEGEEILIAIEDTGPGVPDDMKEAIFMRFGQIKSQKSGQGLGLYITRMLIERYGGRIRVDDRVPGRQECGAAFRFWLKRA